MQAVVFAALLLRGRLPGSVAMRGFVCGAWVAVVGLCCGMRTTAQSRTATQILDRMAAKTSEREAALAEWSCERVYRLEYRGMGGGNASMTVRAEFRAPGEKRLTVTGEQGSKMLCDGVLRKLLAGEEEAESRAARAQSAITNANYAA